MSKIKATQLTPETLHDNYRRLAKIVHPDLNPDDKLAEQKFKTLNETYAKIKNQIESNYSVIVNISLEEAISGCERIFVIPNTEYNCLLSIPAGIIQHQSIAYKNMSIAKGKIISVTAQINITLPLGFRISGAKNNNLIYTKIISWWKLFFGGNVSIKGPDGRNIKFQLPARTKNGHIYKIAGAGLFDRLKRERSPLYIEFFGSLFDK